MTRAAIHDLGYKPYHGERLPRRGRWFVICRNVMAMAWRGWWRMKVWSIGAVLITIASAVPMYISKNEVFKILSQGATPMRFVDGVLPFSVQFYSYVAFALTLSVIAGSVARDRSSGAFELYFCRSVRPLDYVIGQVAGAAGIAATAMLAGPVALALFRIGLSSDTSAELFAAVQALPKALLIGVVGTLAFSIVPLAFGTLVSRPRYAIAAWAAFYLIIGGVIRGLAHGLDLPELAALDLYSAVRSLAFGLFDISVFRFRAIAPAWMSFLSVFVHCAIGLMLIHHRVRRAQRQGLGGG